MNQFNKRIILASLTLFSFREKNLIICHQVYMKKKKTEALKNEIFFLAFPQQSFRNKIFKKKTTTFIV